MSRSTQSIDSAAELARRFQSLLLEFAEHRTAEASRLSKLLDVFQSGRMKWAESQRETADDFNLFGVMGVDGNELCHSNVLAWLLDRRIEHGTHAQEKLGFRLFLEELAPDFQQGDASRVLDYADEPSYWVCREVSGDESRVDVEVAARNKFLIHIENKIGSSEGKRQTHREWQDLQARGKELGVPEFACHGVFLTLDGTPPKNNNFVAVSWSRIAQVFARFADEAKPHDVKLFARHYSSKVFRMLIKAERQKAEVINDDVQ